eukprot:TRINITY_DN37042_c0_g1_i1.p3 TRINITY_DN37042_c0_g1~~TRINITY_DN37042_c0_g1_i1.p3  ORF type:complete len:158 (-),score=61.22 TRINITY_DN37042_c0_g1_i1:21-425(-)
MCIRDRYQRRVHGVFRGEMLCYFIAKGVRLKAPTTAPKYIMALATLVLEKLALYKRAITDPLTGLHTRDFFFSELEQAIDRVQGCLATGGCRPGLEAREADLTFSGTLGVLFLCLLYTSPSPRDRQKSRMPSSA